MTLFAQVEKIAARRTVLAAELEKPETFSDVSRMTKLNREYAQLGPLVEKFNEYKRLLDDKAGAEDMLATAAGDAATKELAQSILDEALTALPGVEADLKLLLLPKDEDDEKNIILEIRGGTGGDEAALFAADMFKVYTNYAATQGWRVEVQEMAEAGVGGIKEVIAKISGQNVYEKMKFESGVHRVQRVPATETQGRVHTSAATVAVLPEAQEADVKIEEKDLRIDVFRSSGPGGQSVNTTDSAVRITHIPTGVVVQCQDEKSQIKNKAKALTILRSRMLAAEKEKLANERSAARKSMVGSGDRSEKIRTYNYPQNRVTDHRIELTLYNLPDFMLGGKSVGEMITALQRADQADKLAALAEANG
jgi:peptide chain release factor 1